MLTYWTNPEPMDPLAWVGRVVSTVAYLELGYATWLANEKAEGWWPAHSKAHWLKVMFFAFSAADVKFSPSKYRKNKAKAGVK